jgi:enoyl-CoA hydratase
MSGYKNLFFELKDGVAIVTVNRPEKMNALNIETVNELKAVFQAVYDDKNVAGVILTGAGEKSFVAGADISEIAELTELQGRKFAEYGQEVFSTIEQYNKPVVAVVNGFALGGGCELAMACHMRIATKSAKFGQPEVNLGIIPGYGGTQRLTQLVGKGRAFEMMLTGDTVAADEAYRIGLANHVQDTKEEAMQLAISIINKVKQKAPLAVGMVIDCVNAATFTEAGYQTEANAFANCCKSDDFKEGTRAFLEKRPARFTGK